MAADIYFNLKRRYIVNILEPIRGKCEKYIGTLVLDSFEVVRLDDVVEKPDDFYYVYDSNPTNYFSSCVISFIPLIDEMCAETYKSLVAHWNGKHSKQARKRQN